MHKLKILIFICVLVLLTLNVVDWLNSKRLAEDFERLSSTSRLTLERLEAVECQISELSGDIEFAIDQFRIKKTHDESINTLNEIDRDLDNKMEELRNQRREIENEVKALQERIPDIETGEQP